MIPSPGNRMSQEAVLRHAWSLVVMVGLAMLAFALGDRFGLWASGALLLVVGAAFAVPLWRRHLEGQAVLRERVYRPELPQRARSDSDPEAAM